MPYTEVEIVYVSFPSCCCGHQATTALKGFLNVTAGPLTCYASFEVLHEAEGYTSFSLQASVYSRLTDTNNIVWLCLL